MYNQITNVQLSLYMIFFYFHTEYTTFGVLTTISHLITITFYSEMCLNMKEA